MAKKLREKMQDDLIAIAKSSNASPDEFISELGASFLNICGWVCDAMEYSEEDRNEFFNMLLEALRDSINKTKERRAKNGSI